MATINVIDVVMSI